MRKLPQAIRIAKWWRHAKVVHPAEKPHHIDIGYQQNIRAILNIASIWLKNTKYHHLCSFSMFLRVSPSLPFSQSNLSFHFSWLSTWPTAVWQLKICSIYPQSFRKDHTFTSPRLRWKTTKSWNEFMKIRFKQVALRTALLPLFHTNTPPKIDWRRIVQELLQGQALRMGSSISLFPQDLEWIKTKTL